MEQIINQLINNFDFSLMLAINVATYAMIKIIDDINGDKIPTTWQKRFVFIVMSTIMSIIYACTSNVSINIIINSCIVAPVAWSWLAKPIAKKLGIDYKKEY